MRVGVMGGTFDPLHYAHLVLAQEACAQWDLGVVVFVPTFDPRYREVHTPFATRYNMCRNVTDLDSRFTTKEVRESFMVDVLDRLAVEMYPFDADVYLILGGDQAASFWTWKAPPLILHTVKGIICTERSMHDRGRILDHWGEHSSSLHWLDIPALDISSSLLRQRVREGLPIRYLVPPAIDEYVRAEGLYRD